MHNLRVFVEVSDRYNWCLPIFAYLFNSYWSELQPVVIFGYSRPNFALPHNFQFHSIAETNYPAEHWSDGFIEFLDAVDDEYFVWMLADYWLSRTVDVRGVAGARDYMTDWVHNCVRFDLTGDRLYSGRAVDVESYGCYDIIETPCDTPYQFSMQAAIWNRRLLRRLIEPNRTPWEIEIYTDIPPEMRVLATRQIPIMYANGVLKGKIDWAQISKIPVEHRQRVIDMIPERLRNGESV